MDYQKMPFRSTNFITLHGLVCIGDTHIIKYHYFKFLKLPGEIVTVGLQELEYQHKSFKLLQFLLTLGHKVEGTSSKGSFIKHVCNKKEKFDQK